jgi:hypothetical protein
MIPAAIMQIADLIGQFGLVPLAYHVIQAMPSYAKTTAQQASQLRKPLRAQSTLAATQLHGDGKLFT